MDIDEDLHTHHLAVYGREIMCRLFASNILISGMQGLGSEIAKNLILAGVKSITVHDEGIVELWDLSSSFIFSEEDLGRNRALASIPKLQELNNSVIISTLTSELTREHLSSFQAVIFTDVSLEKAIEFDDYCHWHQPPIAFIKSEVRGLFGSVFCDFGPEFTVFDIDDNNPHTGVIASINKDNPAIVACVDYERLDFQDGDLVVFSDVQGMTELNDGKPRRIKNARPHFFTIEENTTNYSLYERGGIVTQVKEPRVLNFKPLRQALKDPGNFVLSDSSKFDRPPLLHVAFQALDKFIVELGRFPVAGSEKDARKLIALFIDMNNSLLSDGRLKEVDRKLLRNFAFGARAVLNPMAAMFGGIVGHEVVKVCSGGKFHPLFQFFYFDSAESLPSEPLDPNDLKPQNSRYDAQISVFGSKLQRKLEDAKVFIVGSGALGCEFLKNIALMGACCGDGGKLTVTDGDVVKKSNLSRQFLFRDWNIGQAKSIVVASAASLINPDLRVEAFRKHASPEAEDVFDDTFWEKLTVVINALDNLSGRIYTDQRCLYFQKALLESGVSGSKFHTQAVIPCVTENYNASMDPAEKQQQVLCLVRSFPHNIEHCLTWARSEFEVLVETAPSEVNAYLRDPRESISAMKKAGDLTAREILERVLECLDGGRCHTFQDCVTWARMKFEDYFANQIKELTSILPEDFVAHDSGTPFWSSPKRFPHPLPFSSGNMSHLHFVRSAAILRAQTFGIPIPDWVVQESSEKLAKAVDNVIVPEFLLSKDYSTKFSGENAPPTSELLKKLEMCRKELPDGYMMSPKQFEKDDDTNYHMDLIASLANMRARNFSIPEVDKLQAKIIAGDIIPAIATTSAMATGLVCLELYKVLDGHHKREDYRNTFANMALPLFSMAEPAPPRVHKHKDMSWTVWDRWTLRGNPTPNELFQWLKNKGLNADIIVFGEKYLYVRLFNWHKNRACIKLLDLVKEYAKVDAPSYPHRIDVIVICEDDNGNDVNIPKISIYFK